MAMKLNDAFSKRHSIRNYSNKPVSWGKISLVLEAATHAPCAGGIYTVKLVIISNKEKIRVIADACQQSFVGLASFIIAVCSDTKYTEKFYGERAKMYIRQQAGAAIENMLLKATELGLGACWIGSFDENIVKRELKIPVGIQLEALIPIANPLKQPTTSMRKPHIDLKKIVFFHKYGQRIEKPPVKTELYET